VERVHHETARAGVGGHEPERRQGEPVARVEEVQQAALAAVGQEFRVDPDECLRGQDFGLGAHLIGDGGRGPEGVRVLPLEAMPPDPAPARQALPAGRGHLGQMEVGGPPGEDVAFGRDAHGQDVVVAADLADGQRLEQFGVKGPPEQVQRNGTDGRAKDSSVHGVTARPRGRRFARL
jgi:hypothetical protein